MTNHDVVKKLIGFINPVGESNADEKRFNNIDEMCHLVEMLLIDIQDVWYSNKDDHQASVKKIAHRADDFLHKTVKDIISIN